MPGRISPCPVTGCSSFSAIVEFRAPHTWKGVRIRARPFPPRLIILFFDLPYPRLSSLSLSLFLSFFFFLRFGQFSMEESGVIVRSQCEQQARQKPDEPVDSLGKHLTKNDARSPRAVSTPTASFCFNPLRSTLSATTHTNTCQRRVRGRNCGIYDQFYSRLSFSSLTFCLSVCPSCLSSLFLLLFQCVQFFAPSRLSIFPTFCLWLTLFTSLCQPYPSFFFCSLFLFLFYIFSNFSNFQASLLFFQFRCRLLFTIILFCFDSNYSFSTYNISYR